MSSGLIAGTYRVQIAFRDSDGYPIGTETDPDNVSNGTTTHAFITKGYVSHGATELTRETAQSRGDEKILERRKMGVSDISDFDLTIAHHDNTFESYINGSSVDTTTNSNFEISAVNSRKEKPPEFVLILTTGFTVDDSNEYMVFVFPNVQISNGTPAVTQGGGTNPNTFTYTVTPNKSSNTGMGFTYANTSVSVVDDEDIVTKFRAPREMALTTYIDDGTATDFNLGYQPATTTVGDHFFSIDGADGSGSAGTITQATGAVGWTAGTAGDKVVVFYQTEFDATS